MGTTFNLLIIMASYPQKLTILFIHFPSFYQLGAINMIIILTTQGCTLIKPIITVYYPITQEHTQHALCGPIIEAAKR